MTLIIRDFKDAIEILKREAKSHYQMYEKFNIEKDYKLSDQHYNKYVAIQTAAQFLKEASPGGLAG